MFFFPMENFTLPLNISHEKPWNSVAIWKTAAGKGTSSKLTFCRNQLNWLGASNKGIIF